MAAFTSPQFIVTLRTAPCSIVRRNISTSASASLESKNDCAVYELSTCVVEFYIVEPSAKEPEAKAKHETAIRAIKFGGSKK